MTDKAVFIYLEGCIYIFRNTCTHKQEKEAMNLQVEIYAGSGKGKGEMM